MTEPTGPLDKDTKDSLWSFVRDHIGDRAVVILYLHDDKLTSPMDMMTNITEKTELQGFLNKAAAKVLP